MHQSPPTTNGSIVRPRPPPSPSLVATPAAGGNGLRENLRKTGPLAPPINTSSILGRNHPAQPVGGAQQLEHSSLQVPSVAALSLSDDASVELQLPVDLVADATTSAGSGAREQCQSLPTVDAAAAKDLAYSYPPPPSGDDAGSPPYPALTPHLTRAPVAIKCEDPAVGRGVFATADIPAGEVVEISPVLVLSEEEYSGRKKGEESDGTLRGVEASQLRGYVFTWGRDGSMAVALGLGSLFNHSASPNVSYSLDTAQYTISYRAAKPIKAGEELCIFYGHSVRFSGTDAPTSAGESDTPEDEWGGLGGVDLQDDGESSDEERAALKQLTVAELEARDNEVVEFNSEGFPWKKITEIVDPEDAVLSTIPCYAITVTARYSAIVFQFVRKHANRKFNELGHLKRVKPVDAAALNGLAKRAHSARVAASRSSGSDSDGSSSSSSSRAPSIRTGPEAVQQVLLFPVSSAPANLEDLLRASPLAAAVGEDNVPKPYIVDVPAQAAHTEEQAEEWGRVWPVQVVHIREGAKATRRKRGWERAKMEWIEREARRVWERAEQAGQRGEHPIACQVTDSWYPGFHNSFRRPLVLANTFDTRKTTGNVLAHAACNAIDAVGILDLHGGRPPLELFNPEAADPPYLLTGLTVFISHEPCLLCAMSLLHSRIKQLYYVKRAPGAGGCGSLYNVHEDGGLNHRYEVWEWVGPTDRGMGVGDGEALRCDP
ncbi:hypothetical protein JCM10213_009203 [Rhodosporidiobolus nylandii]